MCVTNHIRIGPGLGEDIAAQIHGGAAKDEAGYRRQGRLAVDHAAVSCSHGRKVQVIRDL